MAKTHDDRPGFGVNGREIPTPDIVHGNPKSERQKASEAAKAKVPQPKAKAKEKAKAT